MDCVFPLPVERLSFTLNVESNRLYAIDFKGKSIEGGCFEFKQGSWFEFANTGDFISNTDFSEYEDTIKLSPNEAKAFIEKSLA